MVRPGVLHIVDTLELGGAERVATTLVNYLSRERFRAFLATTRREGVLAAEVLPDVGRLVLNRTWTLDLRALRRLVGFVRENRIEILHAHSSSVFIAQLAALALPRVKVIWHVHHGQLSEGGLRGLVYRVIVRGIDAVIAVSDPLERWCCESLGVPPSRVDCLPNPVALAEGSTPAGLPPRRGPRIICVANLRPEKDPVNLVRAVALAAREVPGLELLLVGREGAPELAAQVREEIAFYGLADKVLWLGPRQDVAALLAAADVGVLSSRWEGLPLALLEYGWAGLPVVATRVGQCPDILAEGDAGILVSPSDPAALGEALLDLLRDPARRTALGERLARRVRERYSVPAVLQQLEAVYDRVLTQGEVSF